MMKILHINTDASGGGAANVVYNLMQGYRAHSHESWLVARRRHTDDEHVYPIPNSRYQSVWGRALEAVDEKLKPYESRMRGLWRINRLMAKLSHPRAWLDYERGIENFNFPGSHHLFDDLPDKPDIIHCHNLHGEYFDLRALSWLSQQAPTFLMLHDAWLLSGHCAHSFACDRWKTGCGACPDLTIYPPVKRDNTAYNWQRKRDIYQNSRLFVSTPSQWLMDKVEQSMLRPAIVEGRVIPHGIDLNIFRPARRQDVRARLNIPQDATVLLFAASGLRQNIYKDYAMLRAAIAQIGENLPGQKVRFIALGDAAAVERIGNVEIHFVPYQPDATVVAGYYQAADVYLYAARAEAFGLSLVEAMACGTPVVATGICSIPELIYGLAGLSADSPAYARERATGVLVRAGDADAMARAAVTLLTDDDLRQQLGAQAAADARARFDIERQVTTFLEWYEEILIQNREY